MYTSSLLAVSSLLVAANAQATDSSPYSKFIDDANSILAAATGTVAAQLDALNSWQATQTALPNADIDSQYQDYLNAYMTATTAPLPSWVAAIPTSLQPVMTSFLQAEASLVMEDIAPIVSQDDVDVSANFATQSTPTPTASSNMTVVASSTPMVTASSGFAPVAANVTTLRSSGGTMAAGNNSVTTSTTSNGIAGPSPTNSVRPPTASSPQGGADRPASVAGLAAVVGVLGMMVLL